MHDFLTAAQAADMLGLSAAEFAERAPGAGIVPFAFLGAILYRRADISAAAEAAWRGSTSVGNPGISRSSRAVARSGALSVQLPKPKPRRRGLLTKADAQ